MPYTRVNMTEGLRTANPTNGPLAVIARNGVAMTPPMARMDLQHPRARTLREIVPYSYPVPVYGAGSSGGCGCGSKLRGLGSFFDTPPSWWPTQIPWQIGLAAGSFLAFKLLFGRR